MSSVQVSYKDFSFGVHSKHQAQGRPVKAQFELTYGCNLHCVHCYTDPLNRPDLLRKELPFEEVTKALDKLAEEGILWLSLTGGEIFMRKDFLEIYDYAYNKGFLLTLFTNGTLITEKVADHLATYRPFAIDISFHGATPETFDKITQVPGSFKNCVAGIKRLLARKLPVKIKTKGMTLNRHELDEIKTFIEALGLDFNLNSIIQPRLDGDASSTDYRLNASEIVDLDFEMGPYEENCRLRAEDNPTPEEAEDKHAPQNTYRCGCGTLHAHIDPYGKIGACTWQRKDRFDFRDSSISEGLEALAREIHKEAYETSSICLTCVAFTQCEKNPEMAVHETGDVQKPIEHFCDVAFGRIEKIKEKVHHFQQKLKVKE